MYYEDHGSGPVVLLTHAYGASLRMWDPQVAAFADRYRLISWDVRGHGGSDSPDDPAAYSHEITAADMEAILDACGVERAVVGGSSMGGFLSLFFHYTCPERVSALLLIATGPGYKRAEGRTESNRMSEKLACRIETSGLAALGTTPDVLSAKHGSIPGLVRAARGILAQKDARVIDSLPYIAVPTLLLAGSEDKPWLSGTEYMAAKIPRAEKVLISGAGHVPNLEQVQAFNSAVATFIDHLKS